MRFCLDPKFCCFWNPRNSWYLLKECFFQFPQFATWNSRKYIHWTALLLEQIVIYRTIILPVLYGCETWSLTLRDERRLRVFDNRVLRRIFGPKRDEVTGEWRKLHNEELSGLYSLPCIVRVVKSRRMRWAGHVARMGDGRGVHRGLVG